MSRQSLLPIALTQGEVAGVAPEITAKAWSMLRNDPAHVFCLIGDANQFAKRCADSNLTTPFEIVAHPSMAAGIFHKAIPVIAAQLNAGVVAGQPNSANASSVIKAIERAVDFCIAGETSSIVTNPIQKETLYQAGFKFQGHTDFLGHLARSKGCEAHDVMMLVSADLRAVPITVHIPLKDVTATLTAEAIITQTRIVDQALRQRFNIPNPRIAMTGLNPHAGENGAMGREEIDTIIPACNVLRAEGLTIIGPISADTAFHAEARVTYDAIMCMYHDQALIPAKTLDFHGGVNLTLGLPFIRTSPDHGTALALAGTGTARADSLTASIKLAARLSATHVAR